MELETLKEKAKAGCRKVKVKACYVGNKAVAWVKRNPELTIAAIPVVAGAVKFAGKNLIKRANTREAERVKQEYCYDPSLGHYWELKRKLSNQEWLRIERRRKDGEKLGDILSSMNVLK